MESTTWLVETRVSAANSKHRHMINHRKQFKDVWSTKTKTKNN